MRRPEFIAKQARCPKGLFGQLLGRVMARETAAENRMALELLELKPSDHILEIGFGHGRTVALAAALARDGFVAGVDVSERMVTMARRYNRRLIAEGRVELKLAASRGLPYADGRFDKVYSVYTLYFWPNPIEDLLEIRRVMKKGARFVLGFRPKEEKVLADFPSSVYKFYTSDEVRILLENASFQQIQIVSREFSSKWVHFAVAQRDS